MIANFHQAPTVCVAPLSSLACLSVIERVLLPLVSWSSFGTDDVVAFKLPRLWVLNSSHLPPLRLHHFPALRPHHLPALRLHHLPALNSPHYPSLLTSHLPVPLEQIPLLHHSPVPACSIEVIIATALIAGISGIAITLTVVAIVAVIKRQRTSYRLKELNIR